MSMFQNYNPYEGIMDNFDPYSGLTSAFGTSTGSRTGAIFDETRYGGSRLRNRSAPRPTGGSIFDPVDPINAMIDEIYAGGHSRDVAKYGIGSGDYFLSGEKVSTLREGGFTEFGVNRKARMLDQMSADSRRFSRLSGEYAEEFKQYEAEKASFMEASAASEEKIFALGEEILKETDSSKRASSIAEYSQLAQAKMGDTARYLSRLESMKAPEDFQLTTDFLDPVTGKKQSLNTQFEDVYSPGDNTTDLLKKSFNDQVKTGVDRARAMNMLIGEANKIANERFGGALGNQATDYFESIGLGAMGAVEFDPDRDYVSEYEKLSGKSVDEAFKEAERSRRVTLSDKRKEYDMEETRFKHRTRDMDKTSAKYREMSETHRLNQTSRLRNMESFYDRTDEITRDVMINMLGETASGYTDFQYLALLDKGDWMTGDKPDIGVYNKSFEHKAAYSGMSNAEIYQQMEDIFVDSGLEMEAQRKSTLQEEFARRKEAGKTRLLTEQKQNEVNKARAARIRAERDEVRMLSEKQKSEYAKTLSSQGFTPKGDSGDGLEFTNTRPM